MKKIISVFLSLVLVAAMFSGCTASQNGKDNPVAVPVSDQFISAAYPVDTCIDFHTKKQAGYLTHSSLSTPLSINGKKDNSKPEPITFKWECKGEKSNKDYVLNISENENMSDPVTYTTSTESVDVFNLKIDTTYYWNVSNSDQTSSVYSFTTDDIAPRNINVDGVTNVRDLGGRMTQSGTRTKQGLIYRCGRLNESSAETPVIEITSDGISTMCDQLGIKTEIDLRRVQDGETGAITSSPLGSSVAYCSCPMGWEGDIFLDNKQELLKVFAILSDERNYPLIFHCNIGTDRTGMIAFLVNALLGVPEEDLFKDYLFSNFGNIGGTRKLSQLKKSGYYTAVMAAKGDTLSEKTKNALRSIGVPENQIDSVISILS